MALKEMLYLLFADLIRNIIDLKIEIRYYLPVINIRGIVSIKRVLSTMNRIGTFFGCNNMKENSIFFIALYLILIPL